MKSSTLADLPPELLDQIVAYIPSASCLSHLAQTNHALWNYVDQSAWSVFARTRFPTTSPQHSEAWKQTVRSLTTRSRAWDRRAIVARFIEPTGAYLSYPGARVVPKWKRPSGQTVGFTPRIDIQVIDDGDAFNGKTELLLHSAGAQIVLRKQTRHLRHGIKHRTNEQWTTYRPLSAVEGRDDVTTLHILPLPISSTQRDRYHIVTGTANGDLQHLSIPISKGEREVHTYFTTQGRSVQSSSISNGQSDYPLLAAALDNTQLALYQVDPEQAKRVPLSQVDTRQPSTDGSNTPSKGHRIWSTQFLPYDRLAIGLGPSTEPILVYDTTPTGLTSAPIRVFQLHDPGQSTQLDIVTTREQPKVMKTSVYPIVPVSGRPELFFSGAYDGVIRLHDLRSPRATEQTIQDSYDDSAIYSLLLRGQETLIAGTSRHSHLKAFDARMNARAYSYLDVTAGDHSARPADNFSLYLSTRASNQPPNRWRTDGSIYSLASANAASPYIYAGVQNGVIEIASTEILHAHPDPQYFEPWSSHRGKPMAWNGWPSTSELNVAKYEDGKMSGQKSLWDTWQTRHASVGHSYLDARWKGVRAIDLD